MQLLHLLHLRSRVVTLFALGMVSPAAGQSDPAEVPYAVSTAVGRCSDPSADAQLGTVVGLGYERQGYNAPKAAWPEWTTYSVYTRRNFCTAALAVEIFSAERFNRTDRGARLDSYWRLWPGAVGNLRVQRVPAPEVFPGLDVSVGLTHALARGWEVDVSQRAMVYPGEDVAVTSGSAARSMADWYFRGTAAVISQSGRRVGSYAVMGRRYLPGVRGFAEISASAGEQVVQLGAANAHEIRSGGTLSLLAEAYLTRSMGFQSGFSVEGFDRAPTRTGFSFALRYRL